MTTTKPIRLLIADDHQLFRSGIISLLEDVSEIAIIGEAETGRQLVEKYFELKPDVVLIDISMPELSGTHALKTIKLKEPAVKSIFLTMFEGEEYIYHAIEVGAKGILSKNAMKGELIYAIKTVYGGECYFGKNYDEEKLLGIKKKYRQAVVSVVDDYFHLKKKEKKILELISKGLTSQEIADQLHYSKKTIDYYRARLMQRFNIKSLPELISFAVKYSISQKLFEDE